ncbi:hypothetical protein C4375_18875 [Devosia sp. I507]|nr:hypothetical protein C4375_18875 [Devosia sp. I507]
MPVWPDGRPLSVEEVAREFPNGVADTADIKILLLADRLQVEWSHRDSTGSAEVPHPNHQLPSQLRVRTDVGTWKEFKDVCRGGNRGDLIWRGQQQPWRLRTSFHRSGRSDLTRYEHEDLARVWRALTGRTKHIFDMTTLEGKVAFLHLLQHHGFPTPLLDWSESPYVAAFFAFRSPVAPPEGKVRIIRLDRLKWSGLRQFASLSLSGPHFSLLYPLAIENPRAMPQQSLSALSNVDDIEGYLDVFEHAHGPIIEAYDLPYSERAEVFSDLVQMGVTAGSLFPGLDGACEALTHQFFDPATDWKLAAN